MHVDGCHAVGCGFVAVGMMVVGILWSDVSETRLAVL